MTQNKKTVKKVFKIPKILLRISCFCLCIWGSFFVFSTAAHAQEKTTLTSVKEIEMAAQQGNVNAQYMMGRMYANGERGLEVDKAKAFEWYSKAAQNGDNDAEMMLGYMYSQGEGVLQDYNKAHAWYQKAAEAGNVAAQYNLAVIYTQGKGVAQDYEKALLWYQKAAEAGDAVAQLTVGQMFEQGIGAPADIPAAVRWYYAAAKQGDSTALEHFGEGELNTGIVEVLTEFAKKGEPLAQKLVATAYASGRNIEKDFVKSHMWYNLAASMGDTEARELRNSLESNMTADELAEAQRLAREFTPETPPDSQQE